MLNKSIPWSKRGCSVCASIKLKESSFFLPARPCAVPEQLDNNSRMMRSLSPIGVFAGLQILLGFFSANALSLEVPTSLYAPENTTLNIPAAFKVDILSDSAHPINSTTFYLTGIELFQRLAPYDPSHIWYMMAMGLTGYGLEIRFQSSSSSPSESTMTSQHVIWGLLYVALSMAETERYNALTATLKWEGQPIGSMWVNVPARPIQGGGLQLMQSGNLQNVTMSNVSTLLPSATRLEDGRDDVHIIFRYGADMFDKNAVFLTAMRALGDSIEHGLDNNCCNQRIYGIRNCLWVLESQLGPRRNCLLSYRHAFSVINMVIDRMVGDDRFSAILVAVVLDTKEIAHGQLRGVIISSAADQ